MLKFENVSTFYGKIQALHSVNVEINQGEIAFIDQHPGIWRDQ